jgi:hypothetical protein
MAKVYDYVVVGSGLTGLLVANALSRITENVALIEAADHIGGYNKKVTTPAGEINNGLRIVPASASGEKALQFLSQVLGQDVIDSTYSGFPLTFEGGQLKEFLGFGDHSPAFYEELKYFIQSDFYRLNIEPSAWPELLFAGFKGEFLPKSYVTKFNIDEGRAASVTINGTKQVMGTNFIFTGSVKDLAVLLPEDSIPYKVRAKLSKNQYWTALCLDLTHGEAVTDQQNMHILNGTTQDEFGPCIGKFLPVADNGMQVSQWVTFVSHEETEDSEIVGAALKKIKRQIKRTYPTALDSLQHERIFVAPHLCGNGDLKLSGNQALPQVKNLWIASGSMNEGQNLIGSLLQAQLVLSQFGIQKDDFVNAQTAETSLENLQSL